MICPSALSKSVAVQLQTCKFLALQIPVLNTTMLLVYPHPLSAFPSRILSPSKFKALYLSQSHCRMSRVGENISFILLWKPEVAVQLWCLQSSYLPDRDSCFSQCQAKWGFYLMKPQICQLQHKSLPQGYGRTSILDLPRACSFYCWKFKTKLCSDLGCWILCVGGKKVNVVSVA